MRHYSLNIKKCNVLRFKKLFYKSFFILDLENSIVDKNIFDILKSKVLIKHSSNFNIFNFWGGDFYFCFFETFEFLEQLKFIQNNFNLLNENGMRIIGFVYNGIFVDIDKILYKLNFLDLTNVYNYNEIINRIFFEFIVIYFLLFSIIIKFLIDIIELIIDKCYIL